MTDDGGEKLMEAIEDLSQAEHTKIELRSRVAELVRATDIDAINDLPLLYRMEIKRVLIEEDYASLARQIKT